MNAPPTFCSTLCRQSPALAVIQLFLAGCPSGEKDPGDVDDTDLVDDSGPISDTGWRDELTTYDCAMALQGGVSLEATVYSGGQMFIPGVDQPTGYYFELSAITYNFPVTGDGCDYWDAYPNVIDGTALDSYLFTTSISLPAQDDPISYQGSYDYEEEAPFWGPDPSLMLLIGWYEDPDGYETVVDGMAESAGVCLSRVRPDRVSGAVWWMAPDDRPDLGGPFYITFDVGERGPNASPSCFYTSYEFGLEETDVWPQLVDGK